MGLSSSLQPPWHWCSVSPLLSLSLSIVLDLPLWSSSLRPSLSFTLADYLFCFVFHSTFSFGSYSHLSPPLSLSLSLPPSAWQSRESQTLTVCDTASLQAQMSIVSDRPALSLQVISSFLADSPSSRHCRIAASSPLPSHHLKNLRPLFILHL